MILCGSGVKWQRAKRQEQSVLEPSYAALRARVGFFDRGATREIRFIPELAAKVCWDCKECFALCPTSYAQAAYSLTEAFAFNRPRTTAEDLPRHAAKTQSDTQCHFDRREKS